MEIFFIHKYSKSFIMIDKKGILIMRQASKILFLIAGILAILASIAFLVVSIVDFVRGGIFLVYVQAVKDGSATSDMAKAVQELLDAMGKEVYSLNGLEALGNELIGSAVYFLILAIFAIPAAVLAFICKGKKEPNLALIIVATVFLGFTWNIVGVVGGVLGIVDWAVSRGKKS